MRQIINNSHGASGSHVVHPCNVSVIVIYYSLRTEGISDIFDDRYKNDCEHDDDDSLVQKINKLS
jgi:hypothetical protein